MKIVCIAAFAAITKDPAASGRLYRDALGLPLKAMDDYLSVDNFDGAKHFGVWPLRMVAQSCFGTDTWPADIPGPHATIEFELSDVEAERSGGGDEGERAEAHPRGTPGALGSDRRSLHESGRPADRAQLCAVVSRQVNCRRCMATRIAPSARALPERCL